MVGTADSVLIREVSLFRVFPCSVLYVVHIGTVGPPRPWAMTRYSGCLPCTVGVDNLDSTCWGSMVRASYCKGACYFASQLLASHVNALKWFQEAIRRWSGAVLLRSNTQCHVLDQGAAGYRQVAALHSDHYRQVLLYMILLDQGRLAAVDRWLPYTVTTIDRLYCT